MASQAIATETPHGLSVGNVFGRSVNVIKANPVATLGLTFAVTVLQQVSTYYAIGDIRRAGAMTGGMSALFTISGIVSMALWLIVMGALVHAAIAQDQGRKVHIPEILRLGAQRALPLFAVQVLFLLGVWLGSILLIVPGVILAVMWSVSVPAVAAEKTGVFGAFGRSRELTKGARWRVFGIGLLTLVIYLLASILIGVASVAGSGSFDSLAGAFAFNAARSPSILVQALQAVISSVLMTWVLLVGAALFIELRHWKDGPDVDRLTDIFS